MPPQSKTPDTLLYARLSIDIKNSNKKLQASLLKTRFPALFTAQYLGNITQQADKIFIYFADPNLTSYVAYAAGSFDLSSSLRDYRNFKKVPAGAVIPTFYALEQIGHTNKFIKISKVSVTKAKIGKTNQPQEPSPLRHDLVLNIPVTKRYPMLSAFPSSLTDSILRASIDFPTLQPKSDGAIVFAVVKQDTGKTYRLPNFQILLQSLSASYAWQQELSKGSIQGANNALIGIPFKASTVETVLALFYPKGGIV